MNRFDIFIDEHLIKFSRIHIFPRKILKIKIVKTIT